MTRQPPPLLGSTVPGLILGPDEALCASIEWLRESLASAPAQTRKYAPRLSLRTDTRLRRQLIQLYLLFGDLDVQSGRHLLDTYLKVRKGSTSARELFQDFTGRGAWRSTPFSHRSRDKEGAACASTPGTARASATDGEPARGSGPQPLTAREPACATTPGPS